MRFGADGTSNGGRHVNYGVREFGMAAIMNGLALHGGLIPYGGTFLTFSDYSRNAIRMAALMKQRVIHVFTHDSIGLGEDGPTHQSVEHAAALRLIPEPRCLAPGDTAETLVAWRAAIENRSRPTALLLSRQNLPYLPKRTLDDIAKGAYVLAGRPKSPVEEEGPGGDRRHGLGGGWLGTPRHSSPATASPCASSRCLRPACSTAGPRLQERRAAPRPARIAVEAGVTDYWWKYGCAAVVGIDSYGESAPAGAALQHFGFTAENVADTVRTVLARR